MHLPCKQFLPKVSTVSTVLADSNKRTVLILNLKMMTESDTIIGESFAEKFHNTILTNIAPKDIWKNWKRMEEPVIFTTRSNQCIKKNQIQLQWWYQAQFFLKRIQFFGKKNKNRDFSPKERTIRIRIIENTFWF